MERFPFKALGIYLLISFGAAYFLDYLLISGIIPRTLFSVEAAVRMWMPALGAVISFLACKIPLKEGLRSLGIRKGKLRYIPLGLAIPFLIYLLGVGVCYLFGFPPVNPVITMLNNPHVRERLRELILKIGPRDFFILQMIEAAVAGVTINAALALGEEIGWRGLMYKVLFPRYGLMPSSAVIGIIWGLWHAPLIIFLGYNFPHHRGALGIATYCALLVSWTLIMLILRERSGALWPTAVMHGTINGLAGLMLLTYPGVDEIYVLPVGAGAVISSFIIGGVLALLFFAKRWESSKIKIKS